MKIEYWSGTGNSFLITSEALNIRALDHLTGEISSEEEFARQICNGRWGLVSDGFLSVLPKGEAGREFVWNFFNRDGSRGEMCGNAARCVVNFLAQSGHTKSNTLTVETLAGQVQGRVLGDFEAEVTMPLLKKLDSAAIDFPAVDSGVPHILVEQSMNESFELSDENLRRARSLRSNTQIAPNGSNVTFWQKLQENHIRACTFERGVEDVTLACGTGAVAAAWALADFAEEFRAITVDMPGGPLRVRRQDEQVFLAGPTKRHFNLELKSR